MILRRNAVVPPLLLLLLVMSCAPAHREPRPSDILVVASKPPASTPRARVEALLAQRDGGFPSALLARVEITASPISEMPLERNPRPKNAIKMSDDYWPMRLLENAGTESYASFENDRLAHTLLGCFFDSTSTPTPTPDAIVSEVLLAIPEASATTFTSDTPPRTQCVQDRLVKQAGTPYLRIATRVTTRFLPASRMSSSSSSAALDEEIAELNALVSTDKERQKQLTLLLGAHRVLAAQMQGGGSASPKKVEHLKEARAAFDRVLILLAREGDDGATRAAALDGIASVLILEEKHADAIAPSRAIVCATRFSFPVTGEKIPADQDHSETYWKAWEQMHPTPISRTTPSKASANIVPTAAGGPRTWAEETHYKPPYDGCTPTANASPAILARAWRRLGSYHALSDVAAGPYRINRAAQAFEASVSVLSTSSDGSPGGFVSLDLARTYLRQQRYRAAAHVLRALLVSNVANVSNISTKKNDSELTLRAGQLLATSLTHFDLDGPPESEPATGNWPDLIDMETNPTITTNKMKSVVDRTDDPGLVPPDAATQALVMRWMSWELLAAGHYDAASLVSRKFLDRFPLHRDAPVMQWEEIVALKTLAYSHKPQSAAAIEGAKLEAEARARLTQRYTGTTPWTQANKGDAEALAHAVELAKKK